jgi:glycolate oxidase
MVSFKGHTSIADLQAYIKQNRPSLYHGATTSTVIPFTKSILDYLGDYRDLTLVDLTGLPKKMELEGDEVFIEGPVTWLELMAFCHSHNRDIGCYPTEKSACVLSGLATSATGDRCFGFGTLRDLVTEITYLNDKAQEKKLSGQKDFPHEIKAYSASLEPYRHFKNPPVPWFERETDLMIGTEGQLGVITSCKLRTISWKNLTYLFLKVPHWADDYSIHLNVHDAVQKYRGIIYGCEMMDKHLIKFGGRHLSGDLIALEVPLEHLELVYEKVISKIDGFSVDDSFEVSPEQYRKNRQKRPARLAEFLRQNNIVKMGTDSQVKPTLLKDLFEYYKKWVDIPHTLFGHLGDAHLHFNFLPRPDQRKECERRFEQFYHQVAQWQGSPFAEHGIGVLKKDYLKEFLKDSHYEMFEMLKDIYDPKRIFFPVGYMNLKQGQ